MRPLLTPGRGSGDCAAEALGRARVHHLRRTARERRAHLVERGDEAVRRGAGVKARGLGCASPVSSGRPFLDPFRQAALEDAHVLDAIGAQRPPDPRRGIEAERVIDDEAHAVAEAERGHRLGERLGFRQHVRQALVVIGDRVDVEEHGARECASAWNSAAPVRPELGRCQEASITPRSASPSSAASSAVVMKLREGMGLRSAYRSAERDAHAAVDLALLLDAGHRGAADLAGARDMRSPAGLKIEALDRDQAHPARSHRRLDRHGLDEARVGLELGVGDPAMAHRGVAGDQLVEPALRSPPCRARPRPNRNRAAPRRRRPILRSPDRARRPKADAARYGRACACSAAPSRCGRSRARPGGAGRPLRRAHAEWSRGRRRRSC